MHASIAETHDLSCRSQDVKSVVNPATEVVFGNHSWVPSFDWSMRLEHQT